MRTVAVMLKDPKWGPSLAKAADAGSKEGWCGGETALPQRLRLSLKALAKTKLLGADVISKIESCFCAEKVDQH